MITWVRKQWLAWKVIRGLSRIIRVAQSNKRAGAANGWIRTREGNFYCRVHRAYLTDRFRVIDTRWSITLASVEIKPELQGKGYFSTLIGAVETYAKARRFGVVFVENVHNERFREYLISIGYSAKEYEPLTVFKRFST